MASFRTLSHASSVPRIVLLFSAILFSSLIVSGCNCNGEPIAHIVPKAEFNPKSVDFGNVTVGDTVVQVVSLHNTGAITFQIKTVDAPPAFHLTDRGSSPVGIALQPGASHTFDVTFSPDTAGPQSGKIGVHISDTVTVSLDVTGNGVNLPVANLSLDPPVVDFGTVLIGQNAHATVTVLDSGTADGGLANVVLGSTHMMPGTNDVFTLATMLPLKVPHGQMKMLDLVFTPTQPGPASDTMVFTVNPGSPTKLTVMLQGNGTAPIGDLACRPNPVAFHTVLPGMMPTVQVTCSAGGGDVTFNAATLRGSPMLQLAMVPMMTQLHDGQSIGFEVAFNPSGTPATVSGTVAVDYTNAAGTKTTNVRITGAVGMLPVGTLACVPTPVNFGTVLPGMMPSQQVTCTAHGGAVSFATAALTGDPTFQLAMVPAATTLNDGQSLSFNVTFSPSGSMRPANGMVGVSYTNSAGRATAMVPVMAEVGMVPLGTLACMPASIDFGMVPRGMLTQRTVTCSAQGGVVSFTGAAVSGDPSFSAPMVPAATMLNAGQSIMFNVDFNPQGTVMTSVAGTCTVSFMGSMGNATVMIPLSGTVIEPPPTSQAIALILTGDDTNADVDIHLVRPGGTPFDSFTSSDCFYIDCTGLFYSMSWPSPTPNDPSYQPHLDRDPVFEVGTENLNVQNVEPGVYDAYVHYYQTGQPAGQDAHDVSVQVFVAGRMIGTYNKTLHCNQFWHVGSVNWTGSSGVFTPDTAVTMRTEGSCP